MVREVALAIALVSLSPAPGRAAAALTVPPNGTSGCAVFALANGVTSDPADFLLTSISQDRLEVTVVADASDGLSVPGLYEGSMAWTCLLGGTGAVEYGSVAGSVRIDASSTPDALPPAPGNQNDPFANNGYAAGEVLLTLQFDDTGTVVSDVLPDGTPVQLEFQFSLESSTLLLGPPPGPLLAASATYFVKAVDTANPTAPIETILDGNDVVSRTLDTAVGRTIDLQGRLALRANALAGREVPGALYYGDAAAEANASNTALFGLALPANVRFESESGHDYTAAPAPAEGVLLATGALALACVRRRRSRA